MAARLKDKYEKEVMPVLMKDFGYKNVMQVPKVLKVVVNVGLGEAIAEPEADGRGGKGIRRHNRPEGGR